MPAVNGTASNNAPHGPGGLLAHVTQDLGLTPEQAAQVGPILEAAKAQEEAIRAEAQAKRKELVVSTAAQIKPILTPDQVPKLDALVQKMESAPAYHGEWHGQGGPGGPLAGHGPGEGTAAVLDRLTQQLGLTDDQRAQLKPILDAAHEKVTAIHADKSLDPRDQLAKVREAMEDARAQIKPLLTPEQQEKMAAIHAHHDHGPATTGSAAVPAPSPAVSGS